MTSRRTLIAPKGRRRASPASIARAEKSLGVALPKSLATLLLKTNGGTPSHQRFATSQPTSWAEDHVRISEVLGVGYREGIDGELGNKYLIREWGFPPIGVVLGWTPAYGDEIVMLDYRSSGEPRVVFIDHSREIVPLAPSFAEFWKQLTL